MSGIVGGNLGRGSGLVKAGGVGADSVTGASIADDAIDSEHYVDASIDNAHLADNAADTAEIADNAITLAKMAGLARGKLIYGDASGDPAALAAGSADEVLTHDGTDFDWAAAGGGGGITAASQWRLTADATGTQNPIAANWEEVDTDGYATLGSSMTESSGIFTFPSTGIWYINFSAFWNTAWGVTVVENWTQVKIKTTVDNSTWGSSGECTEGIGDDNTTRTSYAQPAMNFIFDVTDTTTHKCSFTAEVYDQTNLNLNGSTGGNVTWVTFIRLGDT